MMGINKKHAILIGAGELERSMTDIIKKKASEKASFIIALDGGLVFCAEQNIGPDMIVGDFDSLPLQKQVLLENYSKEIIQKLPCEKDDTDTLAAIKLAIQKGFNAFTIYGGLGGRFSHSLANIQSLMYLKEKGLQGELVGDNSRIFLIKDESVILAAQDKGYISIFSFSEVAEGVTLKNLKYEIEDVKLYNSFPIGVSNEFIGKTAEISVRQGVLLVVVEE